MEQATVTNNPKYAQINLMSGNSDIANRICGELKEHFGDSLEYSFGTDYDVIYITVTDQNISIDEQLKKTLSETNYEVTYEKTDEEIHLGLGGPLTSRKGHFYRVQPKA